jgi:hypothetical protein
VFRLAAGTVVRALVAAAKKPDRELKRMVVLSENKSPSLVQGRAAGDLSLRIVGSQRDGQIVRLSASKCTIGSARGCTLRLRCVGVRSLDCVILRGSRGTVIRSWSARTRLNGQPFGDALLASGDRLKIGPIELEVLCLSLPGQDLLEREPGQQQAEIEQQSDLGRHEFKGHCAAWQQHREVQGALQQD